MSKKKKKKRLSANPPRRNENPRIETRTKITTLINQFIDLLRYLPVAGYFLYWDRKDSVRYRFRVGALSILSFSLLLLWAEVAAELAGAHWLVALLKSFELRWPVVALFSVAVFLLLIHHAHERRHDLPHHFLGEKVWEFFERRPYKSEDVLVHEALRHFHDIFIAYGLAHVSIFRPDEQHLTIQRHEVLPLEKDNGYFEPLKLGEGVAGLVYSDMSPRYVPRLFFPWNAPSALSAFFPHSMKFEIDAPEGGQLTLVNPNLDLFVFEPPKEGAICYRSFLSVPIKCTEESAATECLGVLNFDFHRTDPLSKLDIKGAVFLGALLGEEISRVRNARGQFNAAGSSPFVG